jgi:poly(3-hydroxybutyrate) depolymerase
MRALALSLASALIGCGSPDATNPASSLVTDASDGGGRDDTAAGVADGSTTDTFAVVEAPEAGGDSGSRCQASDASIACDHQSAGVSDGTSVRLVAYATPLGTAPTQGWPAVVYFQGSFVPGHAAFAATTSAPFGQYQLTRTIQALLDRGYAVLAPDAAWSGGTFWQTNIPPFSLSWSGCADDTLVNHLFTAIAQGIFGKVDSDRLYAMGISSGGFMTSRMAVSYEHRFRALADHSGSYATCSDVCVLPGSLPSDHPPILFLHGDADVVVPTSAVTPYLSALKAQGTPTKWVTADAGHEWLAQAVQEIPAWFAAHP